MNPGQRTKFWVLVQKDPEKRRLVCCMYGKNDPETIPGFLTQQDAYKFLYTARIKDIDQDDVEAVEMILEYPMREFDERRNAKE